MSVLLSSYSPDQAGGIARHTDQEQVCQVSIHELFLIMLFIIVIAIGGLGECDVVPLLKHSTESQ